MTEARKAQELAAWLNVPVSEEQARSGPWAPAGRGVPRSPGSPARSAGRAVGCAAGPTPKPPSRQLRLSSLPIRNPLPPTPTPAGRSSSPTHHSVTWCPAWAPGPCWWWAAATRPRWPPHTASKRPSPPPTWRRPTQTRCPLARRPRPQVPPLGDACGWHIGIQATSLARLLCPNEGSEACRMRRPSLLHARLHTQTPSRAPHRPLHPARAAAKARPAAAPCPVRDLGWGTDAAPIAAALVFCDPPGDSWCGAGLPWHLGLAGEPPALLLRSSPAG